MISLKNLFWAGAAITFLSGTLCPAATVKGGKESSGAALKNPSLKDRVLASLSSARHYLLSKQSEEGFWGSREYPALTGLALAALSGDPSSREREKGADDSELVRKGYAFLLSNQKQDGGIYAKGLANYNTSVSLLALVAANREEYAPAILKARRFLIEQQNRTSPSSPYYGGFGYGGEGSPETADLSNTVLALQALNDSRKLAEDGKYGTQPDLDWDAAIRFVSRCQDLPGSNDQSWAKGEGDNRGGFAYRPNETKAEEGRILTPKELEERKTALRAYGSMSYAGLQSLIYARLEKDDPRVKAVLDWLGRNYTLSENPGMGQQGLYYYYQAMTKALVASGNDRLPLAGGEKIDWTPALVEKILSLQEKNGSWVNANNRWWEADPVLVTSYMMLALEQLYPRLAGGGR